MKTYYYVLVRLEITHEPTTIMDSSSDVHEVLNNMDYNFTSNTDKATITDTLICDTYKQQREV